MRMGIRTSCIRADKIYAIASQRRRRATDETTWGEVGAFNQSLHTKRCARMPLVVVFRVVQHMCITQHAAHAATHAPILLHALASTVHPPRLCATRLPYHVSASPAQPVPARLALPTTRQYSWPCVADSACGAGVQRERGEGGGGWGT